MSDGGIVSTEGGEKFATPTRRRAKRSGFHRSPGARTMKEYPLTGSEMWMLAGLGVAATVCFGMASFATSVWFDVYKDLSAPPPEMAKEMLGYWKAVRMLSGWAAIGLFGFGALFTAINGLAVRRIMAETEHPDG